MDIKPNPKPPKKVKKSKKIPSETVEAVFERDKNICQYCDCVTAGLDEDSNLPSAHCHHIDHNSQGGKAVEDNLNTCCWECHGTHGAITKIDKEWLKGKDVYKSGRLFTKYAKERL